MDLLNAFLDWLSDTDDLIALSLVVIAVFTIALTVVTRRQSILIKESIAVTERALLDLERAHIAAALPDPVDRNAAESKVFISLTNVGRSAGIIRGVFFKFAEPDALPVKPPPKGYEERATDTVLRASESWTGLPPFKLPSRQEGQIFYGYVRYEDAFGRMWRNRFAYAVWSEETPSRQVFQPVGGDIYNGESLET